MNNKMKDLDSKGEKINTQATKETISKEAQTSSDEKDKLEENEETMEDTIALWGMVLDQRGQFCMSQGKLSEAKDMFTKAVGVSLRLHGPDHEQTLVITKVLEKARKIDSENLATFLVNLGMTKLRQGLALEARKWCGEGLELGRKNQDEEVIEQAQKCLIEVNT